MMISFEEKEKREADEAKLMRDWARARAMQNTKIEASTNSLSLNLVKIIGGSCQIDECEIEVGYRGGEPGYCYVHQRNIESWRSARRVRLGLSA